MLHADLTLRTARLTLKRIQCIKAGKEQETRRLIAQVLLAPPDLNEQTRAALIHCCVVESIEEVQLRGEFVDFLINRHIIGKRLLWVVLRQREQLHSIEEANQVTCNVRKYM